MDLHLEVVYCDEYFKYGPFGKDDYDDAFVSFPAFELDGKFEKFRHFEKRWVDFIPR